VDGSCAVNLRPRGFPDGASAATYSLRTTYSQLDTVLHAECADDDGGFQGPGDMEEIFPLYLVRCAPPGGDESSLPAEESWSVLRMEVENCDELRGVEDNGCPPPKEHPPRDPSPTPRDPAPAPEPDCIILGMDVENADC
jgi:hypothetical protein